MEEQRKSRYVTTGGSPSGFFFSFIYNPLDGSVPDFFDADGSHDCDVIFSPIRSVNGVGLLLFKSVRLNLSYYNPTSIPITVRVRLYKKGNIPKDDPTDSPDYSVTFNAVKGEKLIQFPPLFSEEFILRLTWNIPLEVGNVIYHSGYPIQAKRVKQGVLVIKRIAIETEEYGDIRNVWGESA